MQKGCGYEHALIQVKRSTVKWVPGNTPKESTLKKVRDCVSAHKAITRNEISKKASVSLPTLKLALDHLVKVGKLFIVFEGSCRVERFTTNNQLDGLSQKPKRYKYKPSEDATGRVIAELEGLGWVAVQDIVKAVKLSHNTVNAVVQILKKSGRVERKTNNIKGVYLRLIG